MIQIVPLGLCSWNFQLTGDNLKLWTEHNFFGESGYFYLNGEKFDIRKDGILSPIWYVHCDGVAIASITKDSAFSRTFQVTQTSNRNHYVLSASSFAGRAMTLKGPNENFSITPVHAFTRRAYVQETVNDPILLGISAWLTVLLWRRQASNSS